MHWRTRDRHSRDERCTVPCCCLLCLFCNRCLRPLSNWKFTFPIARFTFRLLFPTPPSEPTNASLKLRSYTMFWGAPYPMTKMLRRNLATILMSRVCTGKHKQERRNSFHALSAPQTQSFLTYTVDATASELFASSNICQTTSLQTPRETT